MDKPKFVSGTDEVEVDELLAHTGDLSKPFPHKPNGHLWADAEELKQWRLHKENSDGNH